MQFKKHNNTSITTINILGKEYTKTGRQWLMWMAGSSYIGYKAGETAKDAMGYVPKEIDKAKEQVLRLLISGFLD